MSRFAVLVLLAATVTGCARTPVVPDAPAAPTGFPNHTRAQIVAAVAAAVAPVRAAAADGTVAITSSRLNQEATFSLRARLTGRRSDSLTVVVRGPLGIEGGRGLVTADSLFGVDKLNRVLYLGPASAAERYVPGAGSPEAAARAVLGLLVPESQVAWSVRADGARYLLTGDIGGGVRRVYTVDPALWRVVAVREYDRDGQLRGQQDVSAFEMVQGVPMPRRVHLAASGSEVTFEHRRLALNPTDLRLSFTRPDYRVAPLR